MATESSKYSSVVLTDTFETWRTRTNVMLSAFVANTVTTSNSVHSNGAIAAITHGHGMIRGDIAANNFFANGFIAGGEKGNFRTLTTWTNNTIEGILVVSNNATIGLDGEDEALFNARIRATANAVFRDIVRLDANVYIGSSNADILQVNAVSTFDGVSTFNANTFFNANVSITENLSVTKEVNVTGNGSIGGTFDVTGATDLNSTLNVDGSSTLNGLTVTTLTANGAVDLNSTLNVDGSSTLNGLTVTTLTANSAVDLNSSLNVDGSSTLNGLTVTTFTANGTATLKGAVTLGDATADDLTFTGRVASDFVPKTDGVYNVGSNTLRWEQVYSDKVTSGNVAIDGTTDSTSATTGALTVAGGIGVAKTLYVSGTSKLNGVTATTLTANGTATLKGAVVLGDATADDLTFTGRVASDFVPKTDGVYNLGTNTLRWEQLYTDEVTAGNVVVQSTTDSSSTSTGALIVSGGVGIAKNLYTGGDTKLGDAAADKLLVPSHTLFTSNVYVGDATTDKFYVRGHSLFNANVKFTSSADLFSGGTKILNGTGTVLQNLTANTITLKKYTETRVDTTASSTTLALNLNSGMIHKVTLNSSITTFSFTNIPSGTVATGVTLILIQGTGGSKTISWPGAYKFQGGTAPTLSTTEGDIDVLTFFTYDGGTSWLGTTAGLDFS